jgi:hypothetical protein
MLALIHRKLVGRGVLLSIARSDIAASARRRGMGLLIVKVGWPMTGTT